MIIENKAAFAALFVFRVLLVRMPVDNKRLLGAPFVSLGGKLDRNPLMRQQLPDLTCSLRRQPRQHILQIGIRIMPIHAR